MMYNQQLPGLLEATYEVATGDRSMESLADSIRATTQANSCILEFRADDEGAPLGFVTSGLQDEAILDFAGYFHQFDSTIDLLINSARGYQAITSEQLFPTLDDYYFSFGKEFYHDYLQKYQLNHLAAAFINPGNVGNHSCITVQRDLSRGRFEKEELSTMEFIAPHVRKALNIRQQLISLEAERDAWLESLEHLEMGVILFDSRGKPVFVNGRTEQIVDMEPLLSLASRKFKISDKEQQQNFQFNLQNAIAKDHSQNPNSNPQYIYNARGIRTVHYTVSPISIKTSELHSLYRQDVSAILILKHLVQNSESLVQQLRSQWNLTQKESETLVMLGNGHSIAEIASLRCRSINTVRNQVKTLLKKTDLHKQSDLVLLTKSLV